ncbi:MAG: hypothetical protein KGJ88_08415 [Verrucomicrobiota bacterium]|nr:hypothetical protein [Verrucomicrobiota bacterium]
MKSFINIFILVLCWAQTALAAAQIKQFVLDDQCVYPIAVARDRVTTISFPGPISAIDAANVTVDGSTPGLFQIAHTKGSPFFSVRALATNAVTDVNVRWNDRTYSLELHASDKPCYSVNFELPNDQSFAPPSSPVAVTPDRLLALLDTAKAWPLLKEYRPAAVADIQHVRYRRRQIMDYKTYAVQIDEVFRFNPEDTLVFRLSLTNKTDDPLHYQPDGFWLRVGDRLYPESFSDASGIIPPRSTSPAYFEVTGAPDGGRNDLSLKNKFIVLLDVFPASQPATVKKPVHAVASKPAPPKLIPAKPVRPRLVKPLLSPRMKS